MSEDQSQAVPETLEEAVPPVRAIDSTDPELLQRKLELLKQDNLSKGESNKALKQQVDDMSRELAQLKSLQDKASTEELVKNQKFEVLWNQAQGTVESLKEEIVTLRGELSAKDNAHQEWQIRATALNVLSQNGVHSPDDLFQLEKEKLRLKDDGSVIALVGGIETPLQTYLETLKQPGSTREYFFAGTGARGMSATGSAKPVSGMKSWGSMTLTEQIFMMETEPELAKQLQAQR